MEKLIHSIQACTVCKDLPLGPRPIISVSKKSKIAIIGQAPGTRVHDSGIPWDDPSGRQLRKWLAVEDSVFYNKDIFAIVPMGFCYPGKGKSGDLPPRAECAPLWHQALFDQMTQIECYILIGQYAQRYYLKDQMKSNLTHTVRAYQSYAPKYFPLPHPSPRNRFWMKKNPWFEWEVIPHLQQLVSTYF